MAGYFNTITAKDFNLFDEDGFFGTLNHETSFLRKTPGKLTLTLLLIITIIIIVVVSGLASDTSPFLLTSFSVASAFTLGLLMNYNWRKNMAD